MKVTIAFVVLFGIALAAPRPDTITPHVPVLEHTEVRDDRGQYALSFLTANGIANAEQGALRSIGDNIVLVKRGSYAYLGPDKVQYKVEYVADEHGFQPVGSHLPIAPEP